MAVIEAFDGRLEPERVVERNGSSPGASLRLPLGRDSVRDGQTIMMGSFLSGLPSAVHTGMDCARGCEPFCGSSRSTRAGERTISPARSPSRSAVRRTNHASKSWLRECCTRLQQGLELPVGEDIPLDLPGCPCLSVSVRSASGGLLAMDHSRLFPATDWGRSRCLLDRARGSAISSTPREQDGYTPDLMRIRASDRPRPARWRWSDRGRERER